MKRLKRIPIRKKRHKLKAELKKECEITLYEDTDQKQNDIGAKSSELASVR